MENKEGSVIESQFHTYSAEGPRRESPAASFWVEIEKHLADRAEEIASRDGRETVDVELTIKVRMQRHPGRPGTTALTDNRNGWCRRLMCWEDWTNQVCKCQWFSCT